MENNEIQVRTALSIFNAVYTNNIERQQKIQENKSKMKELKIYVDEFKDLEDENKELTKEISKDREYVGDTIKFYEKQTGEVVGAGALFEVDNES